MRNLLKKAQPTTTIEFMGEELEVLKLSTKQVKDFQAAASKLREAAGEDATTAGFEIQRYIVRTAVVGAADLSDDELDSFPMADFSKLVGDVLEAAGLKTPEADKEGND